MPQISFKDVYEVVERLEVKIDKRVFESEIKIQKLESFNNKALGAWFAITALVSIASSWIVQKILKL